MLDLACFCRHRCRDGANRQPVSRRLGWPLIAEWRSETLDVLVDGVNKVNRITSVKCEQPVHTYCTQYACPLPPPCTAVHNTLSLCRDTVRKHNALRAPSARSGRAHALSRRCSALPSPEALTPRRGTPRRRRATGSSTLRGSTFRVNWTRRSSPCRRASCVRFSGFSSTRRWTGWAKEHGWTARLARSPPRRRHCCHLRCNLGSRNGGSLTPRASPACACQPIDTAATQRACRLPSDPSST